ncbi:MAG TPA: hypothetical protein VLM75_15100 [Spirochaetota bacterium]|nr:hypothetical protein [Spirochaetota bacterium]
MIDDDLDRLLSDVESGVDYSGTREDALRFKQRVARKPDVTSEGSGEGLNNEEGFIERIKSIKVDDDILDYAKGVAQAVSTHTLRTAQFRRLLSDYDVHDNVLQIIQKYKYTLIGFIENIERLHGEYATPLSIDSLAKNARKDYPLFFEGFEDENKVDFLALKELFLRLREFNGKTRKEWSELSKRIGVINNADNGKEFYSELNAQLEAALGFCDVTDKLLRRIADFLSMPVKDFNVTERDIVNKTIYHQSMSYKYDALFNLTAYLPGGSNSGIEPDDILDIDANDNTGANSTAIRNREYKDEKTAPAPAGEVHVYPLSRNDSDEEIIGRFTVKGTNTWNTREPYILRLYREKLVKDYNDLASSFYYSSEPENSTAQEGAVKRAMIRFMSDTSKSIEEEYEGFIYKTLITQVQVLCNFFGFEDDARNLFIYHLGPATLHKVLTSFLQVERIGLCFKYLPANKVVRYIPAEYIKEKILNWHEANINTLNIDFDKVQYFDEIRRTVIMKYNTELANNERQLEEMIIKLRLSDNQQFNKQEFFKSKWNQWFGAACIPVYNRFIEKSVFKQPL